MPEQTPPDKQTNGTLKEQLEEAKLRQKRLKKRLSKQSNEMAMLKKRSEIKISSYRKQLRLVAKQSDTKNNSEVKTQGISSYILFRMMTDSYQKIFRRLTKEAPGTRRSIDFGTQEI
jgi:hypothetical protein